MRLQMGQHTIKWWPRFALIMHTAWTSVLGRCMPYLHFNQPLQAAQRRTLKLNPNIASTIKSYVSINGLC